MEKITGINWKNKGTKFTFYQSYYVDDAAYILLLQANAVIAIKLIAPHFKRFELTIHTDNKDKNETSKTKFVFIPAPEYSTTSKDIGDKFIDET